MFEFLEWDSQFFGKRIGRFFISNKEDLDQLLTSFHHSDYDLIYLIDPNESLDIEQGLKSKGIYVIDRKISFIKEIDTNMCMQKEVTEASTISSDLISIALQSGVYSRFNLDPKLNPKFKDLYTEWISKSVEKKFDDQVFITEDESHIQSLISVKCDNAVAKVGLFAVDHNYRGQGLGMKLLKHIEYWSAQQKAKTIEVFTQKENEAACAIYVKYGFKIKETQNIYHLWK